MNRCLLTLGWLLAAAVNGLAQGSLSVDITNEFPPTPQPGATAGQFESIATTSGGLDQRSPDGASIVPESTNGGIMKLKHAVVGASFASGAPDYQFGDVIQPPSDIPGITEWVPATPGVAYQTANGIVTPMAEDATLLYYHSIHSNAVFASEPGQVEIVWRSRFAAPNGDFTLTTRTYVVSIVPNRSVQRIFWTELPFSGPQVEIPPGVESVQIVYRERFPETVGPATVDGEPDGQPVENRTLWKDDYTSFLRARTLEGRVLVEFLGPLVDSASGRREPLGIEVVDVLSEPVPGSTAFTVDTHLGERLLPSDGDLSLSPEIKTGLTSTPMVIANRPINGEPAYFAERTTVSPNEVIIFWKNEGVAGTQWPRFRNNYNLVWPSDLNDFVLNALPLDGDNTETPVDLVNANSPTLIFQDTEGEAHVDLGSFSASPGDDGTNRSLVLLQANGNFWYLRVYSARQDQFGVQPHPNLNGQPLNAFIDSSVSVGERVEPPEGFGEDLSRAGYILGTEGTAYHPGAYIDPIANGFPTAERQSEIIPVNALASNNQLTVWWYRKVAPPTIEFEPLYWPSVVGRYTIGWPTNPREIVIASNAGTGDLASDEATGSIYVQNDPESAGYNPNEEHALMLDGRGYALRDDLNVDGISSDPYVLIDYFHGEDARIAVGVFKVSRENSEYTFEYDAIAGTMLGAPLPLALLPVPLIDDGSGNLVSANEEVLAATDLDAGNATPAYYDSFTFEDRKGFTWVYRGPHNGGTPQLQMRYRYATLPGFAFPNATSGVNESPPVGSIEPFLRSSAGPGTWTEDPIIVKYTPRWPDDVPDQPNPADPGNPIEFPNVPTIEYGETLTKAKNGLPDVINQTSLEILYQQSRAQDATGTTTSVSLFDSTRSKFFALDGPLESGLNGIPSSVATDLRNGKSYFQQLPPQLKERFFFDPSQFEFGALVFRGEFVDDVIDPDYLLLNTLSEADVATLQSLVTVSDPDKSLWDDAILSLTTLVEVFTEDPDQPGVYRPDPNSNTFYSANELPVITDDDQAVDSYALSSVGDGQGYVTLIAGNGEAFTPGSEPVSMHIIRVTGPMNKGRLKVINSANPLDEKVTLRHSGDLAARSDLYEFEWRYQPPVNGVAPNVASSDAIPGPGWLTPNGTYLSNTFVVGADPPLLSLADNYWIMRYRPKSTSHPARVGDAEGWSEWTDPALVEGWIKRALAGINPFNQRITDFFNNAANTDVSVLTQAGTRWEGDIALNLENINEFGLIEIYETILNRGIGISINGAPAVDYGPANDALLLVSGYLADLYTLLADEAAADAANPTIAFDAQAIGSVADSNVAVDFDSVFSQTSTARFAFQGQVGNLLEEELALLRGRDDTNSPGVELAPSYNRMFWNYTRGINAGEVIYALNYNIRERQEDSADGTIDAEDAQRMYPQGHGDAYGHYLTALKNYYRLLTDPQFTWAPRVEAVNVLGVPVQVDYLDERKFATVASRVAKTAHQIMGLVHRQVHSEDKSQGWKHFRDGSDPFVNYKDGEATSSKRTRHWGLDEWAARGTQGAYFNWVVANALLPAEDAVNTGIQKIDRTTVPELDELPMSAEQLQRSADSANAWLNPLGLAAGSTLFDISPAELDDGKTHFEQIYDRAVSSLGNAFDTFDQATASTRLLRSLENQSDDLTAAVFDQEAAFNLQLIEIYGTPYTGDIGPGKAYAQGYEGPDLFRFFYVDKVTTFSDPFDISGASDVSGGLGSDGTVTYTLDVDTYNARHFLPDDPDETENVSAAEHETTIDYVINPDAPVQYATASMGQRQHPGRVQVALQDLNSKREDMAAILDSYNRGQAFFETELRVFNDAITAFNERQSISSEAVEKIKAIELEIVRLQNFASVLDFGASIVEAIATATSDGFPKNVGFSNDVTSPGRGLARFAYVTSLGISGFYSTAANALANGRGPDVNELANDLDRKLDEAGFPTEYIRMAADVQSAWYDWLALGSNIDQTALALAQSRMQYEALLAEGDRVQQSREVFRKRAAAVTQGYRTRDVAFRTFRTESLEQYQTLLDWSARYAYLAAKAYDYETGLLGTSEGRMFLNDIVGSRALGLRNESGQPIFGASDTGDPGISGMLAKLAGDWSSVNTRLGFNNPEATGTVFSLRKELFRIPEDAPNEDGDADNNNDSQDDRTWREQLQTHIVHDLRADSDVARHALQLGGNDVPQPGIIIPFNSTITDGLNFFGKPLAGEDHAYSTTNFATKIHSVGVVLDDYDGMDTFPLTLGLVSEPTTLSATPYVYFIPTGQDVMRTPPLGDPSVTRSYDVQDFALPLPYNIGASEFSDVPFWTGNDSLTEDFLTPRRHPAFRAVDSTAYFYSPLASDYTNSHLVGRSVWNTGWKLIIPGKDLLNDPTEGLSRFLKAVTDIKLFMRTYSYSGN